MWLLIKDIVLFIRRDPILSSNAILKYININRSSDKKIKLITTNFQANGHFAMPFIFKLIDFIDTGTLPLHNLDSSTFKTSTDMNQIDKNPKCPPTNI